MTLEEKAEEYANKYFGMYYPQEQERRAVEQAYLAGAEENGTVWHDLRKDPNDLPKNTRQVLCAENGGGYSVGEYWEFVK